MVMNRSDLDWLTKRITYHSNAGTENSISLKPPGYDMKTSTPSCWRPVNDSGPVAIDGKAPEPIGSTATKGEDELWTLANNANKMFNDKALVTAVYFVMVLYTIFLLCILGLLYTGLCHDSVKTCWGRCCTRLRRHKQAAQAAQLQGKCVAACIVRAHALASDACCHHSGATCDHACSWISLSQLLRSCCAAHGCCQLHAILMPSREEHDSLQSVAW